MTPDVAHSGYPDLDDALARLIEGPVTAKATDEEIWATQFDLGLARVDFPIGRGGLALPAAAQRFVEMRLADLGVSSSATRNQIGVGLVAPTLNSIGTDDQARRFLKPLFTGAEIWCQLFSEPGAGSDLANLATSATRLGTEAWSIAGQKVWTSHARRARRGLLLARTDPNVPKHRGITCFAVDMRAPGVVVRPIRQINGYARFSEVFLDDVRVSDSDRIGEIDAGWSVAITALANERVMLTAATTSKPGDGHIDRAVQAWRGLAQTDASTATTRLDDLMRLWVRAEAVRLSALRAAATRKPGAAASTDAVGKLVAAELEQDIYEFCVELLGVDALEYPPGYEDLEDADYRVQEYLDVRSAYLSSRRTTIAGGTSEILRNVLAERVLGMPPEPRIDKDVPWNRTARG